MLGIKHVFVVHPAPSSTSTHPKFILGSVVWKKRQKENGMRKEGIHDLTIQSSVLQVFEKKTVKGKGDEKSIEK